MLRVVYGGMDTVFRDEKGDSARGPGGPASREAGVSNNMLETGRSGIKFAWLSIFNSIQEPVTVRRSNQDWVICFCALEGGQTAPPVPMPGGDVIKIELIAGSKSCDSARRCFG